MVSFFELTYEGHEASDSVLDFYDVSQALRGFQRSLAITVHAVINDEVITKAPALSGARIYALPPEEGSWKILAAITFGGNLLVQINALPKETPLGNLVYSAYDYVISESLGFHVDYKETLGQQLEQYRLQHPDRALPSQSRLDSVVEKIQVAVTDMHRPIAKSGTASSAVITKSRGPYAAKLLHGPLTADTYDYVRYTVQGDDLETVVGKVSSYNINTYSGRFYDLEELRTISFDLAPMLQSGRTSMLLTENMTFNVADEGDYNNNLLEFSVYRRVSRSERTKSYHVVAVRRVER